VKEAATVKPASNAEAELGKKLRDFKRIETPFRPADCPQKHTFILSVCRKTRSLSGFVILSAAKDLLLACNCVCRYAFAIPAARATRRNSRALASALPGAKIADPATSMSAPASTTLATVS
jgi:hypothetical protein